MPLPPTIVDVHSHIFNAEDLPMDGFIRKLSPAPELITSILSGPLDVLASWVASSSGTEGELIRRMLTGQEGVGGPTPRTGVPLISNDELDAAFLEAWQKHGLLTGAQPEAPVVGMESAVRESVVASDVDTRLARGLETASAQQLVEIEEWLAEWGDGVADVTEEGLGAWLAKLGAIKNAIGRYIATLRLMTRDRHLIVADLASTYHQATLFVPALVDFTATSADDPSTSVPDQIVIHSLVSKLSVAGRIPGAPSVRVHPFVAFCPYREIRYTSLRDWDVDDGSLNTYVPYADQSTATDEDRYRPDLPFDPERARSLRVPQGPWESSRLDLDQTAPSIDLVRHAIELGGFAGVKLYPPSGFLPLGNRFRFIGAAGERLDAAMRTLYGYCEAMQVPILTHAAFSNGFEHGYDGLAGPNGWELVLQEYPNLRVCFGHFGHLHGVGLDPANPCVDSWSRRFVSLVDRYPNVYADVGNSKLPVQESYRDQFVLLLRFLLGHNDNADDLQLKRRHRLMYGSDYWMNVMSPSHQGVVDVFSNTIDAAFGSVTRDLFMGGNALRFLGLADAAGEPDRDNLNRRRLETFYGSRPRPPWLPA